MKYLKELQYIISKVRCNTCCTTSYSFVTSWRRVIPPKWLLTPRVVTVQQRLREKNLHVVIQILTRLLYFISKSLLADYYRQFRVNFNKYKLPLIIIYTNDRVQKLVQMRVVQN
jgi:hypothetical protein